MCALVFPIRCGLSVVPVYALPSLYPCSCPHSIARVYNDTYHCFKFCDYGKTPMPLDDLAFNESLSQLTADMALNYAELTKGKEIQYQLVEPRVIIEKDVLQGGATPHDVTFWFLANGIPVFVSQQCGVPEVGVTPGFKVERVFVSTRFRKLPMTHNRPTCEGPLIPKPRSWEKQLAIAKEVGRQMAYEGVVRLDLYGGDNGEGGEGTVYFSEFTFTTSGCWKDFQPLTADGLLYAIAHGQIPADVAASPEFVERTLGRESWVLVREFNGNRAHGGDVKKNYVSTNDSKTAAANVTAFSSPVDLCDVLGKEAAAKKKKKFEASASDGQQRVLLEKWQQQDEIDEEAKLAFDACLSMARIASSFPLRCIIHSEGEGVRAALKDDRCVRS